MVSTRLKNIPQIGSFPQVGMNMRNICNHHLVTSLQFQHLHVFWPMLFRPTRSYAPHWSSAKIPPFPPFLSVLHLTVTPDYQDFQHKSWNNTSDETIYLLYYAVLLIAIHSIYQSIMIDMEYVKVYHDFNTLLNHMQIICKSNLIA